MHLKERLTGFQESWKTVGASPTGRRLLKATQGLFLGAILGYLGYKLVQLGWQNVWRTLPTQPLFYLLFLILYVSVPFTEIGIYRITWTFSAARSVPIFFKKRIFNKDVLGYSGEVVFFTWARKHVALPDRKLAETVRDNNILSAAASTTIALTVLGLFLRFGPVPLADLFDRPDVSLLVGGGVVAAILVPIVVRFRKYIFAMPAGTAALIFGIQYARMAAGQALQIGLWAVVLPAVPLSTWLTYAAVSILVARIPVLTQKNLFFIGVGVELASALGVPEAAMFGLLAATAALDKALNFGLFALLTVFGRRRAPAASLSYDSTYPVSTHENAPSRYHRPPQQVGQP